MYEAPCRPDLARHSFLVNCVLAAASPQPSATYAAGTALVLIPATPIAYLCYENLTKLLFSTSSTSKIAMAPGKGWFNLESGTSVIPDTSFFEGDSAFKFLNLSKTTRLYGFAGWWALYFPTYRASLGAYMSSRRLA